MIPWTFILLIGFVAGRREPQCKGCLSYKATIFPFFVKGFSSEDNFSELRRHLLAQVDQCTRTNFSISLFLPSTEKFINCCNARDCTRRISALTPNDFRTNRIIGAVDIGDSSGLFAKAMTKIVKNDTSVYIVADFLLPQLCRLPELRFSLIRNLTDLSPTLKDYTEPSRVKRYNHQFAANVIKNCNVTSAKSLIDLNNKTKPFCSTGLPKSDCKVEKDEGLAGGTDLRIFLGFATRGHFPEIVNSLAKLLSQKVLDTKARGNGKVFILAKNSQILSHCFWHNIQKCIMDFQARGEESIIVQADRVNREDLSFSPDVFGFIRREVIRNTTNRDTIAIVISDFISMRFYEHYSVFKMAKTNPKFNFILAVQLNWYGVDAKLVKKYYGSVMSDEEVYTMNNMEDIVRLAEFVAKPGTGITTTTTAFPLTIPDPRNRTVPLQGTDVVIVLAMATWTTEEELTMLRSFLTNTAGQCVNDDSQYTILKNLNDKIDEFCNDLPCFNEIIRTINVETSVPIMPNAFEMTKAGLDLLELSQHDSPIMPTLVLVIPYVDDVLIREYDDSSSEFRKNLSFVEFKIVLINSTDRYHMQTSINNRFIHRINSFEELEKAANPFCSDGPTVVRQPSVRWEIPVALGSLFFLAVTLTFIFFIHKWRNPPKLERQCTIRTQPSRRTQRRNRVTYGLTKLGQGEFGITYLGRILGNGPAADERTVMFVDYERIDIFGGNAAVKEPIDSVRYGSKILKHEIEIMKKIEPHANIAYMLGCCEDRPLLLTVYAENGDLLNYVTGRTIHPVSDEECRHHPDDKMCFRDVYRFLHHLARALAHIHQRDRQIIHRDVNLRNLLITVDLTLLLGDFGMAFSELGGEDEGEEWYRYLRWIRPPIRSLPPEGFGETFCKKYDIWSFGLCAWQILECGKQPFEEIPDKYVKEHIKSGKQLPRPVNCHDKLWKLMLDCWKLDPSLRPSSEELEKVLGELVQETNGYTTIKLVDSEERVVDSQNEILNVEGLVMY